MAMASIANCNKLPEASSFDRSLGLQKLFGFLGWGFVGRRKKSGTVMQKSGVATYLANFRDHVL
jgi:hypothetical protein